MTQLPSWSDGLYFLLLFPDLVIFLNFCYITFRECWDFLWVFIDLFIYFSVPYFGLACDHGNSVSLPKSEKREDPG